MKIREKVEELAIALVCAGATPDKIVLGRKALLELAAELDDQLPSAGPLRPYLSEAVACRKNVEETRRTLLAGDGRVCLQTTGGSAAIWLDLEADPDLVQVVERRKRR